MKSRAREALQNLGVGGGNVIRDGAAHAASYRLV